VVEEAEPLGERGQLLALLVGIGGGGGHDDAGHALGGECLDPLAGHADRSPARGLQRLGVTAHLDGARPGEVQLQAALLGTEGTARKVAVAAPPGAASGRPTRSADVDR
jgi:hypothetical protein